MRDKYISHNRVNDVISPCVSPTPINPSVKDNDELTPLLLSQSVDNQQSRKDDDSTSIQRNIINFPTNRKPSLKQVIPYYLPILNWLPKYTVPKFIGDFSAGLSLASFQIPLAISFATTMAHLDPLTGLFSLSLTPIVYSVVGSIPQMIVGPESAISLIVGQTVDHLVKEYNKNGEEVVDPLLVSASLTFISGTTLFLGGILGLGFLDNILSQVLLMGFISGVGITMIVGSFITQCKLDHLFKSVPEHYHSTFDKIVFLFKYCDLSTIDRPTVLISVLSFSALILLRWLKKKLSYDRRHKWVFFFPEILFVVLLSIYFSWKCDLHGNYGILLVKSMARKRGKKSTKSPSTSISLTNKDFVSLWMPPFSTLNKFKYELLHPGIMVALLGFFESTTASKSLDSLYNIELSSSNRELVALGSLNIVGSMIGGCLPSFGGYGRSRINALSGAKTTFSGGIMGVFTLLTIFWFLPYIEYVPICVLSSISSVIGLKLLEESPHLLKFHYTCRGYSELFMFTAVFITTITYSLEGGITVGIVIALIKIVKHSTKSRIQLLGRKNNSDKFVHVDTMGSTRASHHHNHHHHQQQQSRHESIVFEIEGCLIVKIPEPLTFTNSSDLKIKLKRLEKFGSTKQHPAAPRSRNESMTRFIIFDINGMTNIDSSAALVLYEIIKDYTFKKMARVFLVGKYVPVRVKDRLANSGILELVQYDEFNINVGDSIFKNIKSVLQVIDYLEACGDDDTNFIAGSIDTSIFNSNIV
ncbi:uncharacterized protein SCDLUD_000600 [Saccharomycodes ludwigii]|nr:hypothetical protein SCDLUD_000600 [Saccharomycodes ludwigii]KAH3902997.1 hypothetical protein SCDLUD_000600 [Saccharomycodes ludwigii]